MSGSQDPEPRLSAMAHVRQSVFASLQTQIEAFTSSGGDLIPLHIGDTHRAPPKEALVSSDAGHRDLSVYGKPAGVAELRDALAELRRGQGLAAAATGANVHVGCGCTHALFCGARAVLDPGDAVLIISPYWPLITGLLKTAGVEPIEVPLTTALQADPELDIASVLDAARTERVRAIYLITPNNPDGHVMTEGQLAQIADFAKAHDLWVLADEVYADFVYDGAHRSIASVPNMGARTITSFSLSKSHGLAGARIGYVVAEERVISAVRRVSNHTLYNVPVAMQKRALAAVENGAPWIAEANQQYREARDATLAALQERGIDARAPAGGSFFFVDLEKQLGGQPLQALLERSIDNGVLVAPGSAFGAEYGAYVRLCFTGVPLDRTLEGIARFGNALEKLT